MPELPEIEALTRRVRPRVTGARIVDVAARVPKSVNLPLPELRQRVQQKVEGVDRRAKYVVFSLPEGSLWLHLGLTAEPVLLEKSGPIGDVALGLSFDNSVTFAVKTTFMGRMDYFSAAESPRKWEEFGIEPLDTALNLQRFRQIVERSVKQGVKALLMDQGVLAGIGNVYSDEILYTSCIHPARKAGSLSDAEVDQLYQATKKVLQQAVDKGGELEWPGLGPGLGCYETLVHGREVCLDTGKPTRTIKAGGRTAYYCPSRQTL